MATHVTRIFSDLHFGDRASALDALESLMPLFEGADELVFNGDTLDTRPSRDAGASAALQQEVNAFLARCAPPLRVLTGNHDPDFSAAHDAHLADGEVYVTHGDVLFDDIVPWSRDAALARRLVARELAALPADARPGLAARLGAYRRAAAAIPQRHQSERAGAKYMLSYVADTVWPPSRLLRVLRAWRTAPERAAALVRDFSLPARYFVMGHTHRFGFARTPSGLVVLNTGSFSLPGSAGVVDVAPGRVTLRRLNRRGREYRFSEASVEFPLAAGEADETLRR